MLRMAPYRFSTLLLCVELLELIEGGFVQLYRQLVILQRDLKLLIVS